MVKRKQSGSAEKTTKNAKENGLTCPESSKEANSTVAGGKCTQTVPDSVPGGKVGQKVPTAPTRSSCRVTKRPRRDPSPPQQPQPKKQVKERQPKPKTRHWALWSAADSKIFFEGLAEHGKDFEAIQGIFMQKHKRGLPVSSDKTKDKIRHFYYRNWHKISKYIDDVEDINKEVLELYGLINYGFLHNRFGIMLNHKTGPKLNELVHHGSAIFKVKNKNLRLRTPVCRILKKLNKVEDVREEEERVRIPVRVCVELVPRTNGAWARVHELAQNPRLRLKLRPDTRVSSIIAYLKRKWRPDYVRLRESLSLKAGDEGLREELYLHAAADHPVTAFEVRSAPTHGRPEIALNRYRENLKHCGGSTTNRSPPGGKRGQQKNDAACRQEVTSPIVAESAFTFSGVLLHNENSRGWPDSVTLETVPERAPDNPDGDIDKTSHDLADWPLKSPADKKVEAETRVLPASDNATDVLPLGTANAESSTNNITNGCSNGGVVGPTCEKTTDVPSPMETPEVGSTACASNAINEKVERFRHGVMHDEATDLTAAELFLMMGGPRKVSLEYEWRHVAPSSEPETKVTNMLRRLIHLAATEFCDLLEAKSVTTSPPRCTCGARVADSSPGAKGVRPGSKVTAARPARRGKAKSGGDGQVEGTSMVGTGAGGDRVATAPSGDGVFKIPANIPMRTGVRYCPITMDKQQLLQHLQAVNNQSDILLHTSRRAKRLARGTPRPLVVQRTLLPKSHQPASRIMTLAMLPPTATTTPLQPAHTGSFMPLTQHTTDQQANNEVQHAKAGAPTHPPAMCMDILRTAIEQVGLHAPPSDSSDGLTGNSVLLLDENSRATKDLTSSSYNLNDSTLLDISLPVSKSDIGEMSLNDSNSFSGLLISPPEGRGDKKDMLASPGKMFNGLSSLDDQWANADDFSLSSFLCDSPVKKPAAAASSAPTTVVCSAPTLTTPVPLGECSRDSLSGRFDLETTLQCMMNESSLDYASKFADLAAQIAAQDTQNRQDKPSDRPT